MKFYPVIFVLICWQCTGGKSEEDFSIETVLDEIAIPTKIINDFFQRSEKPPPKTSIPNHRIESSTVHYENSNGFVPLFSKPYEFTEKQTNFTKSSHEKPEEVKNTPRQGRAENKTFSTDAQKLLELSDASDNRRSYRTSGNRDDFEPLKVSNGTPIIANYDTYYDQSKETLKSDNVYYNENLKKNLRNKDRERGKKIQTYLGTYDDTLNEDDQYSYGDIAIEPKKNSYQHDKANDNYKQNNAEILNQKASLPRTNYASMSTPKPSLRQSLNAANKDQKFKNPIVISPSDYKVDVRLAGQTIQVSTSNPQNDVKEQTNTHYADYGSSDQLSQGEGTNRNYDSADSRDFSEEYDDYNDEKEKSRRIQKNKRRPHHFDSSRKLPKEHRESYDNGDENGRKQTNSKSKSRYRQKPKPVRVVTEYNYNSDVDDSEESSNNANNQQGEGAWNQVTQNVEISHSNGYEVNQIEKPKLHIVPFNIMQTFDHATALDNSQGFDITNAMLTGFVDGSVVSTAAPLVSSTSNYINEVTSTIKPKIEASTPVPDVIVGQSSYNNPVHAVLMPNKLQQNLLNQYVQSTMSPAVFAVTPQNSFSASPTITPQLQQMLNQMQVFPFNQQLITAQPSHQSFQSVKSNANNHNSNYDDDQEQHLYQSTSRSITTERSDIHHKKKSKGNSGQYSASASTDYGTRQSHNRNNKKKNNVHNDESNHNTENNQYSKQNLNSYVQSTVVPAILHTGYGLFNNQNQQFIQNPLFIANPQQTSQLFKATNDAIENSIKQLQYNLLANRNQLNSYSNLDTVGGASNNVNSINTVQKAQLPILGAKNVEIINPNVNANAYAINQIPAAIVTTPIPIFTTTAFIASKPASSTQGVPVSVSDIVNALTEDGTKNPSSLRQYNTNPFLNLQGPDRPFFNPINFVPNYDLVKSQSILNTNVVSNDPFSQQNLNLVPLVPGGNFYKHSQGAQVDLANKPKLSSDLEKYAEEMFKESLRTIYNSHKWNNDHRSPSTKNISFINESDIAKLRNELPRIKNSLRDSKLPKDVFEAHQTENKIRTVKPGHNHKRPDSSSEHHKHHSHGSHHHHHPHTHHHRSKPQINDFLTPPRVNSFVSKSPFHDKPPKKRPAHGPRPNFNHENSRPRPRQGVVMTPSMKNLDAQASSLIDHRYPIHNSRDRHQYSQPDPFQPSQNYNYPSFTTAFPDIDRYKSSGEYKFTDKGTHDINHQRTHNLMGLLMKSNQLPPGMQNKRFEDKDTRNDFEEVNRRMQSQAHDEVVQHFQKKSDTEFRPIPLNRATHVAYPNPSHK